MALTNLVNILNNVAGVRPSATTDLTFQLTQEKGFGSLIDSSDIKPENFSQNLGYHFRVVRTEKNPQTSSADNIGKFTLQINPQQLRQDEEFAIQITPSQQGLFVEHQGSITKQLVISGTTGFHPKKGLGGVTRDGIARGSQGVSGFEQFHRFRNFIANYVEAKKDPENRDLRLIFENPKDGDYFIIEPMKFSKDRKVPQKTLYTYNVTFVLVGRYLDREPTDEVDKFTNILSDIKAASEKAVDLLEDVEGTILASAELVQTVSNDFTEVIIAPLRAINSALLSFNQGKGIVLDIPRSTFVTLRSESRKLRENLVEAIGIDLSLYNSLTNRSSTVQNTLAEDTYSHHTLLNSFRSMERGLNVVLSNNEFFGAQTLADKGASFEKHYANGLNIPPVTTAVASTVLSGDTIQIIAARELGTARRYKELIILNDLVPPFISDTSSEGVLAPGDTILIPNIGNQDSSNIIISNRDYNITNTLSDEEKPLGIDLSVDENFDLIVTNTSDLDLVGGKANAIQALRVLLALEKGALKLFPSLGVDLQIGEKVRPDIAFELQQDLIRTVLISPKFSDAKFSVKVTGGTFDIEGFVNLKNFDIGIPINTNIVS